MRPAGAVLLCSAWIATSSGAAVEPTRGDDVASSTHRDVITLIPLGTGKGATSVYEGAPSSSFVIKVGDRCRLLVDVGLGAVQQAIKYCGSVPDQIYVSHNHTDHAGELPVALIVEETAKHRLMVISAPEVERRLKAHRVHELYSTGKSAAKLARWVAAPEGRLVRLDATLSIITHRSRHAEACFGFVLYANGSPLLGFSGDSGRDDAFYDKLAAAPIVVVDARQKSSAEHASFDEVQLLSDRHPRTRFYVAHYGLSSEAPELPLHALRVGESVELRSGSRVEP